jgi:hypothetical protein
MRAGILWLNRLGHFEVSIFYRGVQLKDYAKISTKEPFKWGEAIASALLLPVLLIELGCLYAAFC